MKTKLFFFFQNILLFLTEFECMGFPIGIESMTVKGKSNNNFN